MISAIRSAIFLTQLRNAIYFIFREIVCIIYNQNVSKTKLPLIAFDDSFCVLEKSDSIIAVTSYL